MSTAKTYSAARLSPALRVEYCFSFASEVRPRNPSGMLFMLLDALKLLLVLG